MAMRNLSTTTDEVPEALILPDDILICILIRLNKRDIVRYRCVCKRWKDLTSQQQFLTSYQQFLRDEPRSIIIAVRRSYHRSPYPISLIRLETPPPQELVEPLPLPLTLPTSRLDGNKFFAHVPHLHLREGTWGFPLPTTTSPEKLYMFSDLSYATPRPIPSISFDFSTKNCLTIIPTPMIFDLIIDLPATVGDSIFFLLEPCSFVRYNTLSGSWDKLPPPKKRHLHHQQFSGTAVLYDDIILFNMEEYPLAYVVSKNEWYPVSDPDHLCSNILGQAVVVNHIIYAFDGVMLVIFALKYDDILKSYTCDLHGKHMYDVPSMENLRPYGRLYKKLVHLGKYNFCVVHNWDFCVVHMDADAVSPDNRQYIQLTYITLSQKELIVTGIRLHGFETPPGDYFIMTHCFSLPNAKFNALEEGTTREQEADFVILPPGLDQFMEKNSSKSTFILEAEDNEDFVILPPGLDQFMEKNSSKSTFILEAEDNEDYEAEDTTPEVHEDVSKKPSASVVAPKSNVPTIARTMSAVTVTEASTHGDVVVSGKKDSDEEKGHYICIRNLPLQLGLDELKKELKKFGPFKVVLIDSDHRLMSNLAVVEFESATSKQNAIKGSPINIGGRKSVIEEKSGSSLTQRDYNWTSCSKDSV